ncbi:MAG: ATP-binding protein [Thermoleophilia bacterium]
MKLQQKIPLYVIAIMLIVAIAGIWPIMAVQKRASVHQFEETASAITTTILSGLEEDMRRQDTDHIQITLDKLRDSGAVRGVDIVAADGTIWASTDSGAIGNSVNGDMSQIVNEETTKRVFGEPSDEVMTAAEPIPATASCRECHGVTTIAPNDAGNLGVIRANISTSTLNESLDLSRDLMIIAFGLAFILVAATLVLLLRRTILMPLSLLDEAAGRISRGDFTVRLDVTQENNEIGAVATSFNDMVDKVEQRTRELITANAELEESSRLKSEFLANMSHELRTPLNVIIGFSEVLRDTPANAIDEEERGEFCENIISSGYHLLELINDVLDLAKVEAGRMDVELEEFYVAPVLNEVIATMQPLATKNHIELNVSVSERLETAYADTNKFRQILYNLLGNAVKFTPDGGAVNLTANVMGSMARFAVSDTGIGIAAADQEHIFSEFKQVDGSWSRQFEGTGLGLSLTRRFVEMMSGKIWVESELGLGSTFYFTLPLPAEPTMPAIAPADKQMIAPPAPADGGYTPRATRAEPEEMPLVLVVEDDQRTSDLIGLWLTQEGYRVDFAADGEEAVVKAKAIHPFAVCLDIMLPKQDGWQVLHELKSNPETANTGVIICSALDNPGLGFALGAADYCVKPLSRRHLLDKLKNIHDIAPFKRSKPQVVVADSNDDSAATTISALERQGFNILRTRDGEQTMSVALENSPDVIIVDQMLPDNECYDVVAFLQNHPVTVDIPVIVTTDRTLTEAGEQKLGNSVRKVICADDSREQLMKEMFRLEKLQPDRARLLDRQTRLYNRRYFEKRLAEELSRSRRYMLDLSTLLIAIDQRSADPDEHAAMVLSLAGLLRSNVRAADPLGRFDANRFCILLPETTREAGYKVANKIIRLVRDADLRVGDSGVKLSISIAAAGYAADATPTVEEIILALEQGLLELSERGGDAAQMI